MTKINPQTKRKLLRMYDDGFRLWRIAKDCGLSQEDVAEFLVDAGRVPICRLELLLANGR